MKQRDAGASKASETGKGSHYGSHRVVWEAILGLLRKRRATLQAPANNQGETMSSTATKTRSNPFATALLAIGGGAILLAAAFAMMASGTDLTESWGAAAAGVLFPLGVVAVLLWLTVAALRWK